MIVRRGTRGFVIVAWFAVAAMGLALARPAQAGLVGYWAFDEGTGTTANDLSPNGNNGTLKAITGGGTGSVPTWQADHTGAGGRHALHFAQGMVEVPDSASLHITNTFTIAAWMYDTGSNYGHLFSAGGTATNQRNWLLQTSQYGGDSAYFWSATNGTFQRSLSFVPTMSSWHHFAVTYDGANMRTYFDGVLKTTKTFAGALSAWGTLRLGGYAIFGSGCEGALDDMVIFNTVEDVNAIMNGTHPEMPLPVVPADLYGVAFNIAPASLNAGDSVDAHYEVTNGGGSNADGFWVNFYASKDSTITTADAYIGTAYVAGIAAGASTGDLAKTLRIPGAFKQGDGTYYVGMIVDSRNDVPESDEANNSNRGEFLDYDGVLVNNTDRTASTIFYVSQSSGDDSYNGLAPSWDGTNGPWKTLAKASMTPIYTYIPGDQLLLKCGDTWSEELHPGGNGTPANPIVIGSYGTGNKPIIDQLDYNQDRIGIHLSDQEGFKIVGLEFNRCMTGIYGEYSDGVATKHYIWIEDCYFHDSLKYGYYATYPNPREIGLGICFFSWERDNLIVLSDITIKNCVFRRLASGVWTNSPDNFNKNASFIYNFGNMTFDGCLFEEGYQWQMGIRGVDGGHVKNCVTVDVGRGFTAWNGVAGAMFFRCKNWLFEDSEWGCISRGGGSGDGEAFDFEGNCDDMTMRNCLFHDTDGPGFLVCVYASDWNYNMGIVMDNCVHNGKSMNSGMGKAEVFKTSDLDEITWQGSRFYLSSGEVLLKVADHETTKRTTFVDCSVKNLAAACSTLNQAPGATASASSQESGYEPAKAIDQNTATGWKATASTDQWIELDFAAPVTINEFRIKEDASSSITRYRIDCWDDATSQWVGCFNARTIGSDFVAPIVSRTTRKVRLYVMKTNSGNPRINEFAVYNDTTGQDVTWLDQGVNSGDTQKVTVTGTMPNGMTQLQFFLEADGTTYSFGPVAATSHQFTDVGDSQTVQGYVRAYDGGGNYTYDTARTPCVIGDRTPPETPAAPTVTWQDRGPNSGGAQKVTVSGPLPSGATRLMFFLDADGVTNTYGPAAETSHQFGNVGDGQTVQGYVRAYDDAGNYSLDSDTAPCVIEDRTAPATPDAPTVTWLDQGLNSGDTQKVTVSGVLPSGATKLTLLLDADGETYTSGPATETSHQFSDIDDSQDVYGYARAYDDAGNYSEYSFATQCVIGDRTPPDAPAAPTVTWLDQGPGSGGTQKVTVSGVLPISATRLEFFLDADGTTYGYGPDGAASHQFSDIDDNQTVYGYLRAYDDAGNYSGDSLKTERTIADRTNASPARMVSITTPSDHAIAGKGWNLTIGASAAASDGTVTKVEFYVDGAKIGEDASGPYECPWNNVSVGTHALTARATYDNGAMLVSDAIAVEVRNTGDANGDGVVDASDYITLKQNFGAVGADWSMGDFNGDGRVDFQDLMAFLASVGG